MSGASTTSEVVVAKVGGSLFDLEDLRERLTAWAHTLSTRYILLVPGGGGTADVIRDLDHRYQLGQENAHWLALRALTLNAYFLERLLPDSAVVEHAGSCSSVWDRRNVAILDAFAFARADEGQARSLPHHWNVTSDSIAARAAEVIGAARLVLLKSVDLPMGIDWSEAGRRKFVDSYFTQAVSPAIPVEAINLRSWSLRK